MNWPTKPLVEAHDSAHMYIANLFISAGIVFVELAARGTLLGTSQVLFVSAFEVDPFSCDLPTSDPTLFEMVIKQVTTLHVTIVAIDFCEGGWTQQ